MLTPRKVHKWKKVGRKISIVAKPLHPYTASQSTCSQNPLEEGERREFKEEGLRRLTLKLKLMKL